MKRRLPWALPTATAIVLSALLIGLGMHASGAYFADHVTIEGLSVQAGYWITPTVTPTPVQLAATVVITPNVLKRTDTEPITARITLPAGYSAGDIDTSSILLCVGSAPCSSGIQPTSTAPDTLYLDATFSRAAILDLLRGVPLPPNSKVYLTVSGRVGSAIFVASDEVRVQQGVLDAAAQVEPAAAPATAPWQAASPTPGPTSAESVTPTGTPAPNAAASVGAAALGAAGDTRRL